MAPPGDRVVDRRAFIGTVADTLLVTPLAAEAQTDRTVRRLGVINTKKTRVVTLGAIDPVGNGFVRSTSRPGTNMTRLMWTSASLSNSTC